LSVVSGRFERDLGRNKASRIAAGQWPSVFMGASTSEVVETSIFPLAHLHHRVQRERSSLQGRCGTARCRQSSSRRFRLPSDAPTTARRLQSQGSCRMADVSICGKKWLAAAGARPERRMRLSCPSPRLCTLVLVAVGIGAFDRVRKHDIDHVQIDRRSQPQQDCTENQGSAAAH
jgi:hypothetical protein